MKINKENYEVFLIDYLDGNLEEAVVSEVEQFLAMNPDIKKEFVGIEKMHLSDKPTEFPLKGKIHFREDGISETDYLCVGHIEGDLNEQEKKQLESLRQSEPTMERELKLFSLTKLKPALQIIFPNKKQLKQGQKIIRPAFWGYSAAASIVAAMIVFVMFFRDDTTNQFSENTVKRKKIGRKVEETNKQTVKTKAIKQNKPVANENKQMAANEPKKQESEDAFVMEFEEIELQYEEESNYASVQVAQPLAPVKLPRIIVPKINIAFSEEHQLSQQLIDENKAYTNYWEKIFIENYKQNKP